MLTAHRYAGLAIARCNDVVDEAGKRGNAADKEGGDGAPITGVFGRVAVHAVEVVHVGYGHITSSDDIVAAAREINELVMMDVVGGFLCEVRERTQSSKWMSWAPRKWYSRRGKQGISLLMRGFSTVIMVSGVRLALQRGRPTYWDKSPATNESGKQLTTADVDVLGTERHEVVGRAYGVRRNVDTERDDDQADGAKGGGSAATVGPRLLPKIDYYDGIPDDLTICRLRRCGGEDAKKADNSYGSR